MANSYNRYTNSMAVGLKKDIVDRLHYVTQNETKIFDMAKNVEAKDGLYHYWSETLHAAKTNNPYKRADGANLSAYTPPVKTEYVNYIEESAVPFDVTKRTAASAKKGGIAGVKDAWKIAKLEAEVELKDGIEWSLLNSTEVTGDGATASQQRGLNTLASAFGTSAYEATATFADVTGGEAEFLTMLGTMRSAGGMRGRKKMLFVSYTNRSLIMQNWKGKATDVTSPANKPEIYADVSVYVSQFGPIALEGHDMQASTKMVVFDAEDVRIAWLYKTQTIDLGRTGLQEGIAAVANALCLEYARPKTLGYLIIS